MALARKSQMLQASFCLFALVAFSTVMPSVAHSQPSLSLTSSTGRSLLQDLATAEAPAPSDEQVILDDLEDEIEPAEAPAAASPDAESPLAASLDAESPLAESLDAEAPIAESPDADAPVAESLDAGSPISAFEISESPLSASSVAESPSAATSLAAGPAGETTTEDLDEVISESLEEDVAEEIITIDSAAGVASMGAVVMAIAFSAAVGFVV